MDNSAGLLVLNSVTYFEEGNMSEELYKYDSVFYKNAAAVESNGVFFFK